MSEALRSDNVRLVGCLFSFFWGDARLEKGKILTPIQLRVTG